MDIVKAFNENSIGIEINIKGSHEEPLFRASDIASVLGISSIRSVIRDFNETEKVLCNTYTLGGNQQVTFLTEKGLYKILFRSRKPIAEKFTNWFCEVVKDIRLRGKFELENQLLEKDKQLEEVRQKLEITLSNREKNIISNFGNGTILYLGYTEQNVLKFGFSDAMEERLKTHKREISRDFTFESVYDSLYNRKLEKLLKKHPDIKNRIFSREYNGKTQTELIQLGNGFTIESLDKIILSMKNDLEQEVIEKQQKEIENLRNELQKSDTELEKRKYIARHIVTGEEIVFKRYSDARDIARVGPHSIKNNYLNKPRQSRGYSFHSEGEAYWEPPPNFRFDINVKATTNSVMCKSIHKETKEISYYNSICEAALFIDLYEDNDTKTRKDTKRRALTRVIDTGRPSLNSVISRYNWVKLKRCGYLVYPDGHKEFIEQRS